MTTTTRVLLADDEPDIQLIARLALKRAGFDVTAVTNGAEVLAKVGEVKPEAILLDWMMPEMDGFETCARLKANPETKNIPVIFVTAKAQESEIDRGLKLGAVGYITKPFDALSLGTQVRAFLGKA
ncbi:MAG: response regulator [Acidobacteria bacterium]|nr:response regulator [Acidobacteriota bacterium]